MLGTTADDPRIVNMTPLQRLFHYEHWRESQKEMAKNIALYMSSIYDKDLHSKLWDTDNQYDLTEEEVEAGLRIVEEGDDEIDQLLSDIDSDPRFNSLLSNPDYLKAKAAQSRLDQQKQAEQSKYRRRKKRR
jgi:hypothetical protein